MSHMDAMVVSDPLPSTQQFVLEQESGIHNRMSTTALWSLVCMNYVTMIIIESISCRIAEVTLFQLNRTVSRMDIDCPGDTISYFCSILSNSENVELTWTITLPERQPISLTFNNSSVLDIGGISIVVSLTNYTRGAGLDSVITLTVLRNASVNGTEIECGSANLDNETVIVFINTSGMIMSYSYNR